MKKKVLILTTQSGDWEGLYINGQLFDEGHHLGEGDRLFLLKCAELNNFNVSDITEAKLTDTDDAYVEDIGNLPVLLKELTGIY